MSTGDFSVLYIHAVLKSFYHINTYIESACLHREMVVGCEHEPQEVRGTQGNMRWRKMLTGGEEEEAKKSNRVKAEAGIKGWK